MTIAGEDGLVSGHGQINIDFAPDDQGITVDVTGDAQALGFPLGNAHFRIRPKIGYAAFSGTQGVSFGPVSSTATLSGAFQWPHFYLEGGGEVCLFACVSDRFLLSDVGFGACGQLKLLVTSLDIGFSYRFSGGLSVYLSSCDLGSVTPQGVSAGLRAATLPPPTPGRPTPVPVRRDPRGSLVFKIPAADPSLPPPNVTITAPDGRTYGVPPREEGYALHGTGGQSALVEQDPVSLPVAGGVEPPTTTFIITPPAGVAWMPVGPWTVALADGSTPAGPVQVAGELPPPSVAAASVVGASAGAVKAAAATAHAAAAGVRRLPFTLTKQIDPRALDFAQQGHLRMLNYRLRLIPGDEVTFIEQAPNTSRVLGSSPTASGALLFDPAPSPDQQRTIMAFVSYHGRPRALIPVKTYMPPPEPAPPRPAIVALQRVGDKIVVDLGAAQHGVPAGTITAKTSDGVTRTFHYGALNTYERFMPAARKRAARAPVRRAAPNLGRSSGYRQATSRTPVPVVLTGIPPYLGVKLIIRGERAGRYRLDTVVRTLPGHGSRPPTAPPAPFP